MSGSAKRAQGAVTTMAVACLLALSPEAASDDILARSRSMYASLKSYADTGTVMVEYGTSSVSHHSFKTYYRAPRHFYFEFTEDKADGASRVAIWCEGADFNSWWSDTRIHHVYPKGQGANAFVGAGVHTAKSATQIPSLLFADAGLVSTLAELGQMTSAGTELVNGRPAHKLTGIARSTYGTGRVTNVRATTVWIDVETLLVRKLFEESPRGTLPGTRSRVTTVFEPRANPPMEDDRFRFALPSQN